MKQRIDYLDIAKGIAFLFVILCHTVAFSKIEGVNSHDIQCLSENSVWYHYFFIPVFFIVSGYFINTQKTWTTYIWQNVKLLFLGVIGIGFLNSLIKNTVTLYPRGILDYFQDKFMLDNIIMFWGAWFIGAIFTARILYFILARLIKNELLFAIMLFAVAMGGGILERLSIPNLLWHQQGMSLCPFIWIGTQLKIFDLSTKQLLMLGGLYVVSFIMLQPFGLNNIDSYCSMHQTPDLYHLPLCFYMGTLGTCLILGISKAIGKCKMLSFIGINSTTWYIINGCTWYGIKIARKFISIDFTLDTMIYLIIVISIVLVYSTLFTFVINQKYVRILKGDTQDIKSILSVAAKFK